MIDTWITDIAQSANLNLEKDVFKDDPALQERSGLKYTIHTLQYFENTMLDACAWCTLPESIIGLEVGITLGKYQFEPLEKGEFEFNVGIVRWGTLGVFVLTFLLQFYVLWCLWVSLPYLELNDDFCHNDEISRKLQLCAVGVFLLSINPAFKDITLELLVVLTSIRLKRDANERDASDVRKATKNPYWQAANLVHVRLLGERNPTWTGICLFIITLEFVVWAMTLVVGCSYLLLSSSVSNLIQSMVAIVFINDVDNLAFSVFVPNNIKKTLSTIEFEVPYLKGPGTTKFTKEVISAAEALLKVKNRAEPSDPQSKYPQDTHSLLSVLRRLRGDEKGEEKVNDALRNLTTTELQKLKELWPLAHFQNFLFKLSLIGSVPIIIVVAVAVVYGLHMRYCER